MGALLLAMKKDLKAAPELSFVHGEARIRTGEWWWSPWGSPTLYLIPVVSPGEEIGDHQFGSAKRHRHIVNVECVLPLQNPDDEDGIVGRTNVKMGLAEFVGRVCERLESNWLGLRGKLDLGFPPTIDMPDESGYGFGEVDVTVDDTTTMYLRLARLKYEAWTVPVQRTVKNPLL